MKSIHIIYQCLLVSFVLASCGGRKEGQVSKESKPMTYHETVAQVNDLQHTKLELEPDFQRKELKGVATLLIKPHFYPVDSLILHAKHMRIESVDLVSVSPMKMDEIVSTVSLIPLTYSYDSTFLRIKLNRRFTRTETYTVRISYVAMPEKSGGNGSAAITDSKGIYFIGPDERNPDKPVQVWTQGETEAASCWFPTIDAPNQKTTQELTVTVPKKFKTISNGRFSGSGEYVRDGDTLRTDYWMQDKPHSPYLFALAVGEFAEIKDSLGDMPVYYYVEQEYEKYARMVFGHTPEMIEFFSRLLQTPYAWDKYHQVVVRDFVSGAMENTGCVIHFDKLQHNYRQHQDNTNEDIISHELFHHWFGDLVTCESWSNLPLNESFATYGEYLWEEYKYGRDVADDELQNFRDAYLGEAESARKRLIRYDYEFQEQMFDAHSYQKGGLVLHALRKHIGDEAFFEALRLYLERYRFKTAELSELRTCFEEITGQDLNWFFNQWFFREGHPEIQVKQERSGSDYKIKIIQKGEVYRLPFEVKIGRDRTEKILLDKDSQVFVIRNVKSDDMVVLDGENQFVGDMFIDKSEQDWTNQFEQATLGFHKIEAFEALMTLVKLSGTKAKLCQAMINHDFYECRSIGMEALYDSEITLADLEPMREQIIRMASNDPKSDVRFEAIRVLTRLKEEKTVAELLYDSSYMVAKRAMLAMGTLNRKSAFEFAHSHRDSRDPFMQDMGFIGIGLFSTENELPYFMQVIRTGNRKLASSASGGLTRFVTQNRKDLLEQSVDSLETIYKSADSKLVRGNAMTALKALRNHYYYDMYVSEYFMNTNKDMKKHYKSRYKESKARYEWLDKRINELKG